MNETEESFFKIGFFIDENLDAYFYEIIQSSELEALEILVNLLEVCLKYLVASDFHNTEFSKKNDFGQRA